MLSDAYATRSEASRRFRSPTPPMSGLSDMLGQMDIQAAEVNLKPLPRLASHVAWVMAERSW